jgi:hypothetical protein
MTTTSIQPIETRYRGCRFRSRLEARFAVFLDALRVPWEYEPQGFRLEDVCYLPDFWLPEQRQWLEIKPSFFKPRAGWRQAYLLAKYTGYDVVIMSHLKVQDYGPEPDFPFGHGWYGHDHATWPDDPDPMAWGRCPNCGTLGMGLYGRHDVCGCLMNSSSHGIELAGSEWDHANPDRHGSIVAAFEMARSARFEHGETPAIG